jgi:hypothetical protein
MKYVPVAISLRFLDNISRGQSYNSYSPITPGGVVHRKKACGPTANRTSIRGRYVLIERKCTTRSANASWDFTRVLIEVLVLPLDRRMQKSFRGGDCC